MNLLSDATTVAVGQDAPEKNQEVKPLGNTHQQTEERSSYHWPDPAPLVIKLPPAPPLDAHALLPKVLADFVLDGADRMPCPPRLCRCVPDRESGQCYRSWLRYQAKATR